MCALLPSECVCELLPRGPVARRARLPSRLRFPGPPPCRCPVRLYLPACSSRMEGCRNTNGKSMAAAALTTSGGGSRTARSVGIDSRRRRAFRARSFAAVGRSPKRCARPGFYKPRPRTIVADSLSDSDNYR